MAPTAGNKRKRGRPSTSTATEGAKGLTGPGRQLPKKRRQQSTMQLLERDESTDLPRREQYDSGQVDKQKGSSALVYQHIAPLTRAVSRHTIDTKWAPLTGSAIDRISQLLNDVERSVVMRLKDERKRTQASTAVQMVARRLHRKLSRGQPFPPSTRSQPEEDFNFEKILDSSRALETQLTPMLHSIELLKAEITKEEALLEADVTTLDALEANAKADSSRRKKAEKTLHDILRGGDNNTTGELIEIPRLVYHRPQQFSIDFTKPDEDLGPIADQLYNHLDSMKGNVTQMEGLASAMDGSRAALQNILFKHIGRKRHEQVILG